MLNQWENASVDRQISFEEEKDKFGHRQWRHHKSKKPYRFKNIPWNFCDSNVFFLNFLNNSISSSFSTLLSHCQHQSIAHVSKIKSSHGCLYQNIKKQFMRDTSVIWILYLTSSLPFGRMRCRLVLLINVFDSCWLWCFADVD